MLFQADKKYLESKPTCFLLLGRPGVGKTLLARKLASDWHSELINGNHFLLSSSKSQYLSSVADLIMTNVKQKTEIGVHARDLLVRGEAVPDQMVAKMLDVKMRSPEVAHHGLFRLTRRNRLVIHSISRLYSGWVSIDG